MNQGAFFDLDETIYRGKSLLEFALSVGLLDSLSSLTNLTHNSSSKPSRIEANREYYRLWKGRDTHSMNKLGAQWASSRIDGQNPFNEHVVNRLMDHKQKGCKIIVVTGSPESIIRPLLRDFPVDNFLFPLQEVKNCIYTGGLIDQCIGSFKAERIKQYASAHQINLNKSFAYGDDLTDVPMLKTVGHPTVVSDKESPVAEYARNQGWEILV